MQPIPTSPPKDGASAELAHESRTETENALVVLDSWSGAAARGLEARQERESIIKRVLRKGQDFGMIPGCGPKPTLLKAGAEKIADALNLWPDYEELQRVEDWDKGLFFYRYRCTLRQRGSNTPVASGIGSCNSRERKYLKQDAGNIINTIDKMGQKRALVAASLNLGFSDHFTQDLEDIPRLPSSGSEDRNAHDAVWDDGNAPLPEPDLPDDIPKAPGLSPMKAALQDELAEFSPKQRDGLIRRYSQVMMDGKPVEGKFVESLAKMLSPTVSDKWAGVTLGRIREARKAKAGEV